MNLLVVDRCVPARYQDGGSVRMIALLRMLLELTGDVTFVASDPAACAHFASSQQEDLDYLRGLGVKLVDQSGADPLGAHLLAQGRFYRAVLLSGGAYAAVRHMRDIRALAPQAFLLYDTVDLLYLREFRAARLSNSVARLQRALNAKKAELLAVQTADCTLAISDLEKDELLRELPAACVRTLPNIHEAPGSKNDFAARQDLLFVGNFAHPPNADAMVYYCAEIHPLVKRQIPALKLFIVGHEPPPEVRGLAADDIIPLGFVADLSQHYDGKRLSIAPLRFGAGIKGKVLASMGVGLPVVATSIGAEGLPAQDGQDLLIADSPADFATAVCRAYTNADLWRQMSRNGTQLVRRHYAYLVVKQLLSEILALI